MFQNQIFLLKVKRKNKIKFYLNTIDSLSLGFSNNCLVINNLRKIFIKSMIMLYVTQAK